MKYSEKNEFIKERWGGPTFKLWRGPGILLLNFEGGPGVPLLNFEGGPMSQSLEVTGSGVLIPLLHHAVSYDYGLMDQLN